MTSPSKRILLYDDHELFVEAMTRMVAEEDGLEVVGYPRSPSELLRDAQQMRPHVVVIDFEVAGELTFELALELQRRQPNTHIFFLSAHRSAFYLRRALEVGAAGYMTKNQSRAAFTEALRRVLEGEQVFSPDLADRSDSKRTLCALSPREHEVFVRLAEGQAKKEIARDLSISPKTVEGHSQKLMSKLGIHDRVALARFAIRERIVRV